MTKEVKKIDVSILQSVAGLNFNYRPGQVVELPAIMAASWEKSGLCKIITETETLKTIHPDDDNSGAENESDSSDLPEDFPGRELLIENGLDTLEKVRAFEDLTSINIVGKKTADQIAQALLDLE